MGRKKLYESSSERVKAWRNRHKQPEYILIPKEEYSNKIREAEEIWKRIGFSKEEIYKAWETYKDFWLNKYGINVECYSEEEHDKLSRIKAELECLHPEKIDFLGNTTLTYIDVDQCLYQLPSNLWNVCSKCGKRFMLLLKECPTCHAVIKLIGD